MAQATRPPPKQAEDPRPTPARVRVMVPARLHLGLLDLNGGLGRRYGSLGLTLEGLGTRLSAWPDQGISAEGQDAARAQAYAETMAAEIGGDSGLHIEIEAAVPAHNGLGSGTQMALAVGTAVSRLAGRELAPRDIAGLLDRGARSGIGLGAFERGGVLLDGGRGVAETPPPILSRLPFPEDWRVLLIHDRRRGGLHGDDELEAFKRLPEFPSQQAAHLCRLMLMSALPALAEGDLATFGAGVTELQRVTGDHFAAAQGGRFASPDVAEVLVWLEARGVAGFGQSSWGPTGFALLASETEGRHLLDAARDRWADVGALAFELCAGRNEGAVIEVDEAAPAVALRPLPRRGAGA